MAELALYTLTGLLGSGLLLSDSKRQRPIKQNPQRIVKRNDETVGQNVYHSKDFQRHTAVEAQRAGASFEASQDPDNTLVIPMYYNTLHAKTDPNKVPNPAFNQALVNNITKYLGAPEQALLAQNKMAGTTSTEWGITMDSSPAAVNPSAVQQSEQKKAIEQIGGSLRGDGKETFEHNNMVPFHSGSLTQNVRTDNIMKESKLETFTGQFKLNRPNRTEVGPIFDPVKGITNIHGWNGDGVTRDLDRFNPNNTGRKQGERPFQQVNVGPGLNAGKFTAEPSGGFHSTVRIMPKDITQLRVDPVLESEGRINHGASRVQKRSAQSQMYRNRPELLVTNLKGERNFTTVGAVKGRRLRSKPIVRDTHRQETSRGFFGNAGTEHTRRTVDIDTKVTDTIRQNFFNTPFRNMAGFNSKRRANDYGKSGFKARSNNRSERPSNEAQMFGNVQKGEKQGPSFNACEWKARTTIKETTEDFNHMGNVGTIKRKHIVYDPEDKARTTIRETTEDNNHMGNVGTIKRKHIVYDPEDKARTTIRETTEDNNRIGNVKSVRSGKGYAVTNVEAPNTNRQFTSDNEHFGGPSSQNSRSKRYDAAYNARTNTNKEVVAKGRAPTNSGPSLGPNTPNLEVKKMDSDRINRYTRVKQTSDRVIYNPKAISECTQTSQRNHLPQKETRLDVGLLDAFKANPLTQSLMSYF